VINGQEVTQLRAPVGQQRWRAGAGHQDATHCRPDNARHTGNVKQFECHAGRNRGLSAIIPAGPVAFCGMDERVERSSLLYERALFDGDTGALAAADRELDAVEADLALARGRVIHGRFLQQREEDGARHHASYRGRPLRL
jgi:hypothetical protein